VTSVVVDDFSTTWQSDGSGLWTLSSVPAGPEVSGGGVAMRIDAAAGAAGDAPPSAARKFPAPLDLRGFDELRLWLRSSRPASAAPDTPFYLALEATTAAGPQPPWRRLLPVARAGAWELHCLWLGDMADELRQAVATLRLRSLDPTVAFRACLGELIATLPEPIGDLEEALVQRLDNAYSVLVEGTPASVPAIVDVPESPGTRTAPFVLVTPWSLRALEPRGGASEVVDNFTPAGAHTRPARRLLRLEYRIDAFVTVRRQKSHLLERIVYDLAARRLRVGGELLEPVTFEPSESELAGLVAPGRTPLFYRWLVPMEAGARRFRAQAVPFLTFGQPDEPSANEAVAA
jgi:hypothetical protein